MLHSLPDGTRILLRPIAAGDKDRLSAALGRLSQETIRRRFLAEDPDTIVGVARCIRLPLPRPDASSPLRSEPDTAEFAIVVGDPLQGRGLGSLLARELAAAARAVGIRRFAATMLSDNEAVRDLMATISAHLAHERIGGGLREVVIDLAA